MNGNGGLKGFKFQVLSFILFLLFPSSIYSQTGNSIIQEEVQRYGKYGFLQPEKWDSVRNGFAHSVAKKSGLKVSSTCLPDKRIWGWYPYWMGTTYTNYNWSLLTDLCYFDYAITPSNGNNSNTSFNWNNSSAITMALSKGTKVSLCATLFSSHSTFLSSANGVAQSAFYKNVIALLKQRSATGLNIDFEGMALSNRPDFITFMSKLSDTLKTAIPGAELSFDLPAVDWNTFFDKSTINTLSSKIDFYIIMAYDYYWSGSTTAGPTDPLYNFETSYNYTLSSSITNYTRYGILAKDLLLAVPYYGREWETFSDSAVSAATGNFSTTRYFNYVKANTNGSYSKQLWDTVSYTPYYVFQQSNKWRHCFINSQYSLEKRFDMVNKRGLGGIGIWALGYDDGYPDFWNAIQNKFSSCSKTVCVDTIYDMGGPSRNYYNNEKYTYTLHVDTNDYISLSFLNFDVEKNFDSLWIYNGASLAAPLVGVYTGKQLPGTVNSIGNNLTFRFKSDGATVGAGWKAIYTCFPNVNAGIIGTNTTKNLTVYPNPFSSATTIEFELESDSEITLDITNTLGQSQELICKQNLSRGLHSYVFGVENNPMKPGIYFIELITGQEKHIRKVIAIE